jgi:hypothetical protein
LKQSENPNTEKIQTSGVQIVFSRVFRFYVVVSDFEFRDSDFPAKGERAQRDCAPTGSPPDAGPGRGVDAAFARP